MPELTSEQIAQKERKEFRAEVQGMVERYQRRLQEAVESAQERAVDDVEDGPEHIELVQEYGLLLVKLQLLLTNLDRFVQQHDLVSKGGG